MFVSFFLKRVLPFALTSVLGALLWGLLGPRVQVYRDVSYLERGGTEFKACRSGARMGAGIGTGVGVGPNYGGGGGGQAGGVDYDKTFSVRDVTRKAVLLSKPEPSFTTEARENEVVGTVKLRMILGADGRVSNIAVVKGLPDGLTESAIDAARLIKFTPALKDGRSVSQWVMVEYNFNVD